MAELPKDQHFAARLFCFGGRIPLLEKEGAGEIFQRRCLTDYGLLSNSYFKPKGVKHEKGTVNCNSVAATADRISEGIGGWKDELIYISENATFVILLCVLI